MSLCLRTFPNKVTSFVNTRKQVTAIDRQLPKHVKSSLFLEQFLGRRTATSASTNRGAKPSTSTIYPFCQNSPISYTNVATKWSKVFDKRYNWSKQQTAWLQKQRQKNAQTLTSMDPDVMCETLSHNNIQGPELRTEFNSFCDNKKPYLSRADTLLGNRVLEDTSLNSEKQRILYTEASPHVQKEGEKQSSEERKPSEAQLQNVFDCLSKDLPMLFVKTMDYTLYTQDLVFINNIRGVSTTGLVNYVKQIAFLKIIGHIKFAYIRLNVMKMTMHPEDNTIKVRWRIVGISGTHVFLQFWKVKVWNMKQHINDTEAWYDGFSTFHVNNDGKVFKHVVDKMMPDEDTCDNVKNPVGAKLALFTALIGSDSCSFVKLCSKIRFQLTGIK